MGKIKQLIEDHPNIWEFIKFNVLSNCATITNFIIMWLCTGFIFKCFANTPFKFLVFNYADNIESNLGLCGFFKLFGCNCSSSDRKLLCTEESGFQIQCSV